MTPEKRLLVVDDDAPIRALLTTVFRRRGFPVDTAADGEHAVLSLSQCRYSLIILDLMMPRLNGYQVIDHVSALPREIRPLILLLTAGLEPKTFDPQVVVGTMRKPFDVQVLVDVVAATLDTLLPREQVDGCPPVGPDALPRDRTGFN